MVERPAITWKGAHAGNYTLGRGGYALEFVVVHIMEGTLEGCAAWFNDPRARASTHFGVGKDGRIWQFVDLADTAYAHGAVEVAREGAPVVLRENWGTNPNVLGIGIEHEGFSGEAMTAAQFDASTRLSAWLFATVLLSGGASNVAPDRGHILRHGEISPLSRARCPGYPEVFFTRYVARLRELLGGMPPAVRETHASQRMRALEDALTVQAMALDDLAVCATIQAANLRALVFAGPASQLDAAAPIRPGTK